MLNPQSMKTIFHQSFEGPKEVAKAGGVITGSPVFRPGDGIILDGSNDFITYSIPNTLLAREKISFVVEFVPDFNLGVDAIIDFYSSTNAAYRIFKHSNAGNNVLGIVLGGTVVQSIPFAAYSPYWKQNERNVLVLSTVSGNTNVWLNGSQILTNDVTAWTITRPVNFYIGASFAGTNKFDGTIKSFSVLSRLLTSDEALHLYNNSLFTFF